LSNVRVTYSGLIAFAVAIIGVFSGMVFVVMVSRKITPEDFGLWSLIGSMVSYVIIFEPITTYWTTRQLARGEKVVKTALTNISIFSAGGMIIYSIIAVFISASLGADFHILLLASLLIPIMFFNNLLDGIVLTHKPQVISYGTIGLELSKIPIGIIFVVAMQWGIVGALLTTIFASFIRLVILFVSIKPLITDKVQTNVIKYWLRMSWLLLYRTSAGLVHKLDIMTFSLFVQSFVGLGYWQAALTTSSVVGMSSSISQALYPKLLVDERNAIAVENLKRTLYFAIPMVAVSILFAKPILYILNPLYVDASLAVVFLSLNSLVGVLTTIFFSILGAYDKVDVDKTTSFKLYLKSKLFLVPTLNHIMSALYVGSLIVFLLFFRTPDMDDIDLITIWSIILLATHFPFLLYSMIIVKKQHAISMELKPIIKYALTALLAAIVTFFIIDEYLIYYESIYDFLIVVFPIVSVGGLIYFGITYLIDNSTRTLFKSIFKEFTNMKK
jgi:O-antigen/teichoic acid export membrane protein